MPVVLEKCGVVERGDGLSGEVTKFEVVDCAQQKVGYGASGGGAIGRILRIGAVKSDGAARSLRCQALHLLAQNARAHGHGMAATGEKKLIGNLNDAQIISVWIGLLAAQAGVSRDRKGGQASLIENAKVRQSVETVLLIFIGGRGISQQRAQVGIPDYSIVEGV